MSNMNSRYALSLLIAAGGCIAGAYSAFAAYSNGKVIAEGTAGIMFGLAFSAVVVISWIMLPWADKRAEERSYRDAWLWRISWLLALGFVLANSIAYCAHYRTEMTETKGLQIEAYQRALRAESLAEAELNSLRTNYRWTRTSGCSSITDGKSRWFCDHIRSVEGRLHEAQAILAQGRPGAKDAGAEILAWVLGADEAKIRRSLPIFWAVILELIASLCMREAFATIRSPAAAIARNASGAAAEAAKNEKAFLPEIKLQGATLGGRELFSRKPLPQFKPQALNDNLPFAAYA